MSATVLVGIVIQFVHASSSATTVESDTGTRTAQATVVNDASASGSKAIKFTDDAVLPVWGAPVWRDEFNGTTVDTTKWNVRDKPTFGNLSFDASVIYKSQVQDHDGLLHILGERMATPVASAERDRYFKTGYLDTIANNTGDV